MILVWITLGLVAASNLLEAVKYQKSQSKWDLFETTS